MIMLPMSGEYAYWTMISHTYMYAHDAVKIALRELYGSTYMSVCHMYFFL
jgi:hypothetical protein